MSKGITMKKILLRMTILTALGLLWALPAAAEWSLDTSVNNPVCTATGDQYYPEIMSDGAGGAIITWRDDRDGDGINDIYVQRVDGSGDALWTTDGVAVCAASGNQNHPQLVSDGSGGAIITWSDPRMGNEDIYAQRVDGSGAVLWTTDGVAVCAASGEQSEPYLVSDGAGGAIITWIDTRSGNEDIYAQRVDGSGGVLWTADGMAVCLESGEQSDPHLVGDGAAGAIIVWQDDRDGNGLFDIYAMRMDGLGAVLWSTPVHGSSTPGDQIAPQLVSDGAGGAIIVWEDDRDGNDLFDIYAQRVDGSGAVLWTADGVAVHGMYTSGEQSDPHLVSDGAGGAIIVWQDDRNETGLYDICAQRVNGSGTVLWTPDGVAVHGRYMSGDQSSPRPVGDGAGGAIIAWLDDRDEDDYFNIFAQRVDGSGDVLWTPTGSAVCTAVGRQYYPGLVSDGSGGAIFKWRDKRFGGSDVYAQWLDDCGYPAEPRPEITEMIDYPGDQGGLVVLSWAPSGLDNHVLLIVTHYSVWMRMPDAERSGWSHVEDVGAYWMDEYACNAPTYGIFGGSGEIPWTEYKVVAHTSDPSIFWESEVASGYSVDNLAPGSPQSLNGTPSGTGVALHWAASGHHDEDLAFYKVFRSDVSGFIPDVSTLLDTSAVMTYNDTNPGAGTWYYLVTGEDVHGNEGLPSNEASATIASSATVAAALTCLPSSGTVPFITQMTATLTNNFSGQMRRLAGRVHLTLAGGGYFANWRAGFTNVAAGGSYIGSWNQNIPALGSLIGDNIFRLVAEDVTPAPWNQPPYPPAGDTDTSTCTVTGVAQ